MASSSTVATFFATCVSAVQNHRLIRRESRSDKEFHFQNWVKERFAEAGFYYETGGRNSYPDFRLVNSPEGYEVKGLAYPGRETTYDANSQVPSGHHNGRTIFYVFGRYPMNPDGNSYPLLDLVVCHGDFLNADHAYVHKNQSVRGFGSYGDILIRDRKMYVAPTPFGLVEGVAHTHTLILPAEQEVTGEFKEVGLLMRVETDSLVVSYQVDLQRNLLTSTTIPNPSAGKTHLFRAWRLHSGADEAVTMRR
ncbi:MAG: hypothetical protein DYG89_14075 [Caldilinea sp. CFX5]|nr:hypothetical protein [Caldilinea sp. CFX5]